MKKILSAMLATIFIVSFFTSCKESNNSKVVDAKKNESKYVITTEQLIEKYNKGEDLTQYKENILIKGEVEKKMDLTAEILKYKYIPLSGNINTSNQVRCYFYFGVHSDEVKQYEVLGNYNVGDTIYLMGKYDDSEYSVNRPYLDQADLRIIDITVIEETDAKKIDKIYEERLSEINTIKNTEYNLKELTNEYIATKKIDFFNKYNNLSVTLNCTAMPNKFILADLTETTLLYSGKEYHDNIRPTEMHEPSSINIHTDLPYDSSLQDKDIKIKATISLTTGKFSLTDCEIIE